MGLGCALLLSLFVSLAGIVLGYFYIDLTRDLPSVDALPNLLEPPNGLLLQPTRLYDRTGEHVLLSLENPAAVNREYLTLDANQPNYLPPALITATLATTDPDFWTHPGFYTDDQNDGELHTLAQRLVSELLLWDEPPGWRRDFRERLLAAQITARFGRERLLTWYLNSTNYGRLAFGADAASRVYFDKPASELSLAEAALLAGVAQAPALNPLDTPTAATERQRAVLQEMLVQGVISSEQLLQAQQESLTFSPAVVRRDNLAPAFSQLVLDQLSDRYNLERLERGGYRITTSLDYDLQLQAECAASAQLARLAGNLEEIKAQDGSDCKAARLLPTIPQKPEEQLQDLTAEIAVYDPVQGQLLALVGNEAAFQSEHPTGTILSPFIYLTAFTRGLSPASLLWDIPGTSGINNFNEQYHGPVRLRLAMANDYLTPANQVITQVGLENVWKTIQQFGLTNGEAASTSRDLLEKPKASLIQLSQAYGAFANQGILAGERHTDPNGQESPDNIQPVTILHLEDALGRPWSGVDSVDKNNTFIQRPVINTQLAYLMTNALSDETARWQSLGHPNPLEIGRPAAAKIGQTVDGSGGWTLGYTPDTVVGVYLGSQEIGATNTSLSRQAAALWHAVMQYAQRERVPQDWDMPAGVSQVRVCDPSGLQPSADCPNVVNEVFLTGTEPTQLDNLYRSIQVNRETGRLATALTPQDLITERVYLIVPPEAQEWASQSGLLTPPQEYDIIQDSSSVSSPNAQITSPVMLATVKGTITLEGTAAGENFAFYRLLTGNGLNPRNWLQIGEDITQPVEGGKLGVWDTQGLDGLYTIQLQVVRNDQRVESDLLQVTVDNIPPQAAITSPLDGQEAMPRAGQITLSVDAQDNLEIQLVEFYLDGKLLDKIYQSPYALSWESLPGTHSLRVVAMDKAGNTAESAIEFSVK
jgi:membrane peptidoglycan carboxypeptidase